MKIALVSSPLDLVLPPVQTSLGIWTFEVARRLSKSADVVVYLPRRKGLARTTVVDGARFDAILGAPIAAWHRLSRLDGLFARRARPFVTSSLFALDYIISAARLIRQQLPEIIHVQNSPQYVPLLRRACPRAKLVLHMHCEWLSQLEPGPMAKAAAAADLIVGCSDYIVDRIVGRFPFLRDKCGSIPNGTNLPVRVAGALDAALPRTILFVGRLSPEKGLHDLLDAFVALADRYQNLVLRLVGPLSVVPRAHLVDLSDQPAVRALEAFYPKEGTDYRAQLIARIPERMRGRVDFRGAVPQAELTRFYDDAFVLVNPSLSESFGMSVVEAMAHGIPVVASRTGGMVEILERTGGGLAVAPGDPAELACAIETLVRSPELRAELSKRGRAAVAENFSWDIVARRTLEHYASGPTTRSSGQL